MTPTEFNALLLQHADFLKPFAIALTKDTETAKDLYQETMFRALANHEKYLAGTNIRAWLFTIMRNVFINDYRRKAKQNLFQDHAARDLNSVQHYYTTINAEHGLRVKDIQGAVYHLPVLFKRPFLLYYEGFKYYEIASMLEEPLGTIKSRIHFARKLLKGQVARY